MRVATALATIAILALLSGCASANEPDPPATTGIAIPTELPLVYPSATSGTDSVEEQMKTIAGTLASIANSLGTIRQTHGKAFISTSKTGPTLIIDMGTGSIVQIPVPKGTVVKADGKPVGTSQGKASTVKETFCVSAPSPDKNGFVINYDYGKDKTTNGITGKAETGC